MRRSAAHDVCHSEGVEACGDRRADAETAATRNCRPGTHAERLRRRTVQAAQSGTPALGYPIQIVSSTGGPGEAPILPVHERVDSPVDVTF